MLGEETDKLPGKFIDVLAVIALIAGTATTFSVSMSLLSAAITKLFGFTGSKWLTIVILIVICLAYTIAVITGMKG